MTITEAIEVTLVDPTKTYLRAAATVEDIDLEQGIIEARLVPYEHEVEIDHGLFEVFTKGAFAAAVGNPSRCKITDQGHQRSVAIGKAVELRSEDDGLYGKLKIVATTQGRDMLLLLREKVLDQLSVEFRPMRGRYQVVRRGPSDVLVRHHKAELVGVSPVSAGAYGDQARVLLVRSAEIDRAREKALALLDSLTAGPQRA